MNKSNFDFLKGVNDFIYTIACAAENNYPDDPNTTLVKMRIFGGITTALLEKIKAERAASVGKKFSRKNSK